VRLTADGRGCATHRLALLSAGNATMAFAQAQAALDDALAYVQARQQFGRPLVDFQAVQLKLADMALKVRRSCAACAGAHARRRGG